jgi:hypothetical protein
MFRAISLIRGNSGLGPKGGLRSVTVLWARKERTNKLRRTT